MLSAVFAFVSPTGSSAAVIALSTGFTLLGSLGFLTGAVLSVPESMAAQHGGESAPAGDTSSQQYGAGRQ
jgi:hypothetical protein